MGKPRQPVCVHIQAHAHLRPIRSERKTQPKRPVKLTRFRYAVTSAAYDASKPKRFVVLVLRRCVFARHCAIERQATAQAVLGVALQGKAAASAVASAGCERYK